MNGDGEDEVHAGYGADRHCVGREEAQHFSHHPSEIEFSVSLL